MTIQTPKQKKRIFQPRDTLANFATRAFIIGAPGAVIYSYVATGLASIM